MTNASHLLCPSGTLRAAINLGNPLLAGTHPDTGAPCGVSVDLAGALAQALGVPLELVVFDSAGRSVDAVTHERADVGFFAVDPLRAKGIAFTPPYLLIEGAYLVREDSPLHDNHEVDAPGHRVVVGLGSAYDLYLTRELKHAAIDRAPTSPAVVDTFIAGGQHVAAGVRQQLEADAARLPGLRLLPGRFMEIAQAMGLPAGRGSEAAAVLTAFVEAQIDSGFVAEALRRHRVSGGSVPAKRSHAVTGL